MYFCSNATMYSTHLHLHVQLENNPRNMAINSGLITVKKCTVIIFKKFCIIVCDLFCY